MTAPGADAPDDRPAKPAVDPPQPWAGERPGDSVCWLRLVCPECGTLAEAEPPLDCPQCGTRIEACG